MTVINPNSISGITSITLPSGGDNVLTIHTNDGTERFRIDSSGNVKVGSACTISQDGDAFFTGVTTANGSGLTNLPAANLTGTLPAISAANLTNVPAANITGTLPAISAANLTSIPAANITGTLPAISAANLTSIPAGNLTGTLPAISGANLTGITAPIFGNYAVLMGTKSEGTDGGTFTANQWQVRELSSEYYDPDGIVTLDTSTSIFVLQAGHYFIRFSATAHRVGTHKCVLFRESGTQTIFAQGSSERLVTDGGSNRSEGVWRGQISGTVNLQIRHRCSSTRDNDGLGKASSAGEELYTIVEIFKEA